MVELEVMEEAVQAIGMVHLEELRDEPTQKRVSLTDPQLTKAITELYREKSTWKADELADRLNHPKEPIKRMLGKLGEYDSMKKWYTLKDIWN